MQDLFQWGKEKLTPLGDLEAQASCEWMLEHLLGLSRSDVYLQKHLPVSPDQEALFRGWVERCILREPLAYILGESFFWNEKLAMGPGCLVPRPETEILVQVAGEKIKTLPRPVSFLDLGTGSGAIAIALLKNDSRVQATLVDLSLEALEFAGKNIRQHGLEDRATLLRSDLFQDLVSDQKWDLVVSNPPYLSAADLEQMEPELRYEPREALYGGSDGLDFYRRLIADSADRLNAGGWLVMEMGIHQSQAIRKTLELSGLYQEIEITKDYLGVDRVIAAQKK